MRTFCLHHLSAQAQHPAQEHAQSAVLCMLSRLERLQFLRQHKKAVIYYDRQLEGGSLEQSNRNFLALVNSLQRDQRVRWFLAIKNHTDQPVAPMLDVQVQDLPNRTSRVNGLTPREFVAAEHLWLSFVGTAVFDADEIGITNEAVEVRARNCCDLDALIGDWPKYEASPKHRLEEYRRNGVVVSPMDLLAADAQAALLISVEHDGSRYARVRGKTYRFIETSSDGTQSVFHGFRVDDRHLSRAVVDLLE